MKLNTRVCSLLAGTYVSILSLAAVAMPGDDLFMVVHAPQSVESVKSIVSDAAAPVSVVETFESSDSAFTVFEAKDDEILQAALAKSGIVPISITSILDINTPVRGGGNHAGDIPREGHQTFVIQRKIPGVGYLSDEKKAAISKGSNGAIAKIGDTIEWDHSYLTGEGTFCVYRADTEETIMKHALMIGPEVLQIDTVSAVRLNGVQ